jgi:hypothetical protein
VKTNVMLNGKIALAMIALGTVFAVGGKAECGIANALLTPRSTLANLNSLNASMNPLGSETPLTPQVPTEAEATSDAPIAGLWNVTFTSGGQVVDQGFDLWNSDGTEILNDTPAPASGNVCLGVWTRTGQTFKLKHPSWTFDSNGNLNGTVIIREKITLDPRGQNYYGMFILNAFDLHGNPLYSVTGQISAQRITVDF